MRASEPVREAVADGRVGGDERVVSLLRPLRASLDRFLQRGLRAALAGFFPLVSSTRRCALTFEDLVLPPAPLLDAAACRDLGLTFALPLTIVARLVVNDDAGAIVDIKEQEVYFGELPLLDDDGCFVVDGVRRYLVPRHQALWLPSDATDGAHGVGGADGGADRAPRLRLMWPGDWLEHAVHVGLQPLRDEVARFDLDEPEALMPHDLLHATSIARALRRLLTHPALCPVVDERKNRAWLLDRVRRVGPPAALTASGEPPPSKAVDDHDALVPWDGDGVTVAGALGVADVAFAAVRVVGAADDVVPAANDVAGLVEQRIHVLTVDVRDTPWGAEQAGAIVDVGAVVAAGDVLVFVHTWSAVPRGRAAIAAARAAHPHGVPRAERALRVPDDVGHGGAAVVVVDVRVLRRKGLELLPVEQAAIARARAAVGEGDNGDDASARRLAREERGHDLPPGVIRRFRVTLQERVPLAVGDVVVDLDGVGGPIPALGDDLAFATAKKLLRLAKTVPKKKAKRARKTTPTTR